MVNDVEGVEGVEAGEGVVNLRAVLVSIASGTTGTGIMPTDVEQEQEQEPLLDELGNRIPDVYPLIHAIRAVRTFLSISSYLHLLLLIGHNGNRPITYKYLYNYLLGLNNNL